MQQYSSTSLDNSISRIYYEKIYKKLPISLKKLTFQIFYSLKLSILVRIKHLKIPIFSIVGKEKHNHAELKILFCGEKQSLDYLLNIIYSEKPEVEFLEKISIFFLSKKLRKATKTYDMVFVKTDRFFTQYIQKKGFDVLPEWAEMQLDITKPFEELSNKFTKSAKDDIRKIKIIDYKYKFSSDSDIFEDFYHKIYHPFIVSRHEELTIPEATNYNEIKVLFEKGSLFIVQDKDRVVSGFIPLISGSTAFFTYAGVEIKDNYLTKAAGSALYYFFIDWSKKQGFKLLKFGGVRPFLDDGLFDYKKKWGMSVKIYENMYGVFGLKILNKESKAVYDFLINNPFIYIEGNELNGMVFTKDKLDTEVIQQIWKAYYIPGLIKITIVTTQKIDEKVKSFISSEYNGKIMLKERLVD